jgi:acetyltransferase-like isoleucine patch superfamily enzyme
MSFIRRIFIRLKIELGRRVGPVMIDGFKSADGTHLNHVRYGSTTYFQNKESIQMGNHVYIAQNCFIDASNGLKIGEGCQICQFSSILTHSSHNSIRIYGSSYPQPKMIGLVSGSVELGQYFFIGPYSTIMPGTRIGKGSLITAYSYVEGEYPDFSIISGNPARRVGDTRKKDMSILIDHPELLAIYESWAGKQTESSNNSESQTTGQP